MKILFTGGSSFTGCWFIREMARAGHEVVATFQKPPDEYPDELRRRRVSLALEHSRGVFECSFGDARFLELLGDEQWDMLCHHAADVTDYKSESFDIPAALRNNTLNVAAVLEALKARNPGSPPIILTGSVFENDEGAGSQGLPAFSPYGLSKSLTYQVFRYHAARAGLPLGKFVIPNPFGPLEEPRFTAYLVKTWFAGKTAAVNTPDYVRDNIHVSLLAKAYLEFASSIAHEGGIRRMNPSGYVESQGAFALRFAAEMRPRLGLDCAVDLKHQTEFPEPRSRINTDPADGAALDWDETDAWDEIAGYYKKAYQA
jgi:nucleoside-diphosphate-sugar epimerase